MQSLHSQNDSFYKWVQLIFKYTMSPQLSFNGNLCVIRGVVLSTFLNQIKNKSHIHLTCFNNQKHTYRAKEEIEVYHKEMI